MQVDVASSQVHQLRELGLVSMGEIATIRAKTTGLYKGRGRPPIRISRGTHAKKEISGALLISRSTLWRRLMVTHSEITLTKN